MTRTAESNQSRLFPKELGPSHFCRVSKASRCRPSLRSTGVGAKIPIAASSAVSLGGRRAGFAGFTVAAYGFALELDRSSSAVKRRESTQQPDCVAHEEFVTGVF